MSCSVAAGETLRGTDLGRPKAIIRPVRDAAVIERGYEQGWLSRLAGRHRPRRFHRRPDRA